MQGPVSPDTEGLYGEEESRAKTLRDLVKIAYPEGLSDLNLREINFMSALETLAKILDSDVLRTWNRKFLKLRVSRNRLGRREISSTLTLAGVKAKKGGAKSIKDLFSGLKA